MKIAEGSLARNLFFLVWQPAHAVRFALRADPLLRSLLDIRSSFIFEATAETLELFFHPDYTFAVSPSSSSTVGSFFAFNLCSASTFRAWAISSGVTLWRISSS